MDTMTVSAEGFLCLGGVLFRNSPFTFPYSNVQNGTVRRDAPKMPNEASKRFYISFEALVFHYSALPGRVAQMG